MKNSLQEQNKSIVRQYWDGKWNERHPEIFDELLSTDIKYHGDDEMTGIEEYKTSYNTYLSAMINTRFEIKKLIA